MRLWRTWRVIGALCLSASAIPFTADAIPAARRPAMEDISPNTPNGTVNGGPSAAGLMVAVVGDERALYAVSLNAGVWKSVAGGPWRQLPHSPARACCIAVDPNDAARLAVGERNGLAVDPRLNGAGAWESRDAGSHWTYVFDPLTLAGCRSQAVPAVAFSRKSTLFIATTAGIGRRPRGARAFDFSRTPAGIGPVTAFAMSESKVWARTRTRLLVSSDDGLTWTTRTFPTECGGYKIGFYSRGDAFSLAAFDSMAFLVCKPNPDTTGNRNTLLLHDLIKDRWQLQLLPSGDGTGLGGRRFVKSFVLHHRTMRDGIGGKLQLFFGAGQEVHQALGMNADGAIQWDTPVQTDWAGPPHPTNHIHADIWDFHIGPSFCPPKPCAAWIACDGGVFRTAPPASAEPQADRGRVQQMKWVAQVDGLHTHHIHTLTVLPAAEKGCARLAYSTSDNDAWFRDGAPGAAWRNEDSLGDANWTAGDAGNPALALLVRHVRLAVLTAFGAKPPSGISFTEGQPITLNNDQNFDGPLCFQFIQTLKGERPEYPLLDAVMLVQLPLKSFDEKRNLVPVPGPLGQPNPGGGPVLIRNTQFAASPDPNVSKFQTWHIEASDLPPGARGFWVSGGHAHPTYYLYTLESGRAALYQRKASEGWQRLNLMDDRGGAFNLLHGGQYGPAFINPYDPNRLFLVTNTGIKESIDGGATFRDEAALTALLTASGMFPLAAGELTGNGSDVVLASRANALSTLAHVAFDRDHPAAVVAASPFTGVFFAADDSHTWRALTPYLPQPLSAVSAVGLDGDAAYVATEGRSLARITGYREAPAAAYFETRGAADESEPQMDANKRSFAFIRGSEPVAILRNVAKVVVAYASVRTRIRTASGRPVYDGALRTDADGRLFLPRRLEPGAYLVELRFAGNGVIASTETGFVLERRSAAPRAPLRGHVERLNYLPPPSSAGHSPTNRTVEPAGKRMAGDG